MLCKPGCRASLAAVRPAWPPGPPPQLPLPTSTPWGGSKRVSRTPPSAQTEASGRTDTAGQTDQETFHAVLSEPDNRYLVRQLCWVLTIQGLETYLLRPRDPAGIDLLVNAIRPAPGPGDIDVVIGWRGPIAPPEL